MGETEHEWAMDKFFNKNYAMILATYLEKNHDELMEHAEEMYEDHKGQDMKWQWKE